MLLEGLTLEECVPEGVAQRTDGIGEHMIEHEITLQVCENRGCANGDV